MKQIFTIIALLCAIYYASAQPFYTTTTPQNKNAIIEEFTGVKCSNCPAGHTELATILSNHPGRAFGIAYHPTNSNYTTPYSGDPDFRRAYLDAFYSTPFCGTSRFMPSAFINRVEVSGEKIQSRPAWAGMVNTVLGQSSPLNVGLTSSYNSGTSTLSVTVEVYFTSTVTDALTVYVMLAENNLTSQQSGATETYTHKHTFRESLVTQQWGESIPAPTTSGSLFTKTYTFNNATTSYNMSNCEVSVFVRNASSEEIISGNQAPVGSSTGSIELSQGIYSLNVYPNPMNDQSVIAFSLLNSEKVHYNIYSLSGKLIYTEDLGTLNTGEHFIEMNAAENLASGLYFLQLQTGNSLKTIKISKQ